MYMYYSLDFHLCSKIDDERIIRIPSPPTKNAAASSLHSHNEYVPDPRGLHVGEWGMGEEGSSEGSGDKWCEEAWRLNYVRRWRNRRNYGGVPLIVVAAPIRRDALNIKLMYMYVLFV